MKVNIVQYTGLANVQGEKAPIGDGRIGGQTLTADGDFTAINTSARLIRVSTDTTIYFRPDKAGVTATSADIMLQAGSVEFFPVGGGATPSFITAP